MQFLRSAALRAAPLLTILFVLGGCSTVATVDTPAPVGALEGAQPVQRAPASAEAPPPAPRPVARGEAPEAQEQVGATPPAPPADLWARIRAGFALPPLDTPLVAEKERFYLQRPDYLQRMFARGSRYLFHIVEEIEKRGLPTELALLPFVESAMNPEALSSARAAGLWQFIPSTGRQYNLRQDWWVDNRRDVVKSTAAALDYLQKIHAMHGDDWFLALASYNWGEGAVARAVKRNQARGLPGDYLSLTMPAETRHYVPKLIALKNILLRAGELGVALPELPNRPYFVTIEKTRPIDLKLAARFAGMSVPEFVALNPAHNRPVIAASRNNLLKLPADRVDAFLAAVEHHEKAQRTFATWQPHTLKPGESIDSLAQRGGVTVAELREANDLRAGQRILPGTRILTPQRAVDDETHVERFEGPRVYELVERPAAYHRVKKRETLAAIARRYRTTVANLKLWNGIREAASAGMDLIVRPASAQTILTTESGQRMLVRSDNRAPRPMRAVLRSEAPTPAPAAPLAATRSAAAEAGASERGAGRPQAKKPQARKQQARKQEANQRAANQRGTAKKPVAKTGRPAAKQAGSAPRKVQRSAAASSSRV